MTAVTATYPVPGSLSDDVMVAAAFLAAHADDLLDPPPGQWPSPADRCAAAELHARSARLFDHARTLARQEHTP